jgi:hypothetical protein
MRIVSDPDAGGDDWRNDETRKLDLMIDQVADLARSVKELADKVPLAGHTQTVIHKTAGAGAYTAAAIVACFATWLGLIVCGLYVITELHDLRAWRDIHQNHISAIEAREEKRK